MGLKPFSKYSVFYNFFKDGILIPNSREEFSSAHETTQDLYLYMYMYTVHVHVHWLLKVLGKSVGGENAKVLSHKVKW